MNRVMIVGAPGSGKSTLARQLGEMTGLPVFHMDHIHWKPGWEERARPEKIAMALDVEAQERWIFEGGLSSTFDTRAARADLILWLDLPIGLRLWRVATRTWRDYGKTRADLTEGCTEYYDPEFYHYILTTRRRNRARLARLMDEAGTPYRRFRTRRAVTAWLGQVEAQGLVA